MTGPETADAAAVDVRRLVPADPQAVYDAWLDPALVAQWLSPVGHAIATIDARPTGRFRVVMIGEGRELEHVGAYQELIPGRRLVFTWRSAFTAGDSLVTVDLVPLAGGTEVRLRHERLPAGQAAPHRAGWVAILDRLAALLGTRGTR